MLKIRFLVFALLIFNQTVKSQVDIQIFVKQSHTKLAKLFFHDQSGFVVDSSLPSSPGLYKFNLPKSYKQGLYRLTLGKNISVDFIVASEPRISLETVVFAAEDSIKSIESKENEVFFQYQRIKKRLSQKIWLLNSLIDYYPDSSLFYKYLNNEQAVAQIELFNAARSLALSNPNLFTSNLILLEARPIPSTGLELNGKKLFIKQNWWLNCNLSDIRFVNSLALESKVWGFIELFIDMGYDKEQQDSSFIAGVKTIMNLNAEPAIKSYLRSILFKNYIDSDYDEVTKFIFETSFDGLPSINLSPEEKESYRILQSNSVGSKAKNFTLNTFGEPKIKLSKISVPYKLLVFWSLWCPHCTELLPELYNTYQKFKLKGFEVVNVCIDDEQEGWKRFVYEKRFSWIDAIEPDNGENKIIKEFNVDGTPKLFLLDKDLTIISRPTNVKQLEAKLKQLLK
ncbi:MAG: hypothetical protein EHM93_07740 [Bacteroidales bacterium]|nr:MAG: hypothetical protein EHM93_07740 [Bacteroidales bacterium]